MSKLFSLIILTMILLGCRPTHSVTTIEIEASKILYDTIPAWQIFIEALIEVESRNNPNAVGKSNDVGVLQITPIYVREVNRIQSNTVYTLQDRLSPEKSLEMFEIMQSHYNPGKDIDKAIKSHNPHAPASYRSKIKNKMDELTEKYETGAISFELHGRIHEAEVISVEILESGDVALRTVINN